MVISKIKHAVGGRFYSVLKFHRMKIIYFILLVFYLGFSCRKTSCFREFEFHFPATITQGDTFDIGDTLWIEMDLPNKLIDHQTGEEVDLSDFDLYLGFGINKLDTNYVNNYITNFDLIERVGTFRQQREGSFLVTYAHFDSLTNKHLYVGVVPKRRGAYVLTLSLPIAYSLAEEEIDPQNPFKVTASDPCRHGIAAYSGTRFDQGFPNYYLIRQYRCVQASPTDTLTICMDDSTFMANRGGHAFVVQ